MFLVLIKLSTIKKSLPVKIPKDFSGKRQTRWWIKKEQNLKYNQVLPSLQIA